MFTESPVFLNLSAKPLNQVGSFVVVSFKFSIAVNIFLVFAGPNLIAAAPVKTVSWTL